MPTECRKALENVVNALNTDGPMDKAEMVAALAAPDECEALRSANRYLSDMAGQLRAELEQVKRELATVGTITLCATCGGTGELPGGSAEYSAGGCCPIGHARECGCRLCVWRKYGYRKDAELEQVKRELAKAEAGLRSFGCK